MPVSVGARLRHVFLMGGGREGGSEGGRAAMCFTLTEDMEEERRLVVVAASLGFLCEVVGVAASGAAAPAVPLQVTITAFRWA